MADVWVRLPLGALLRWHGTPIGSCDQAQTLVCVGSNPSRATRRKPELPSDARWAASPPVKRTPLRAMWVQFPPGALDRMRCELQRLVLPTARISGCQPDDAGSIPARAAC